MGRVTHLLSVARDMTERRASDERMREQAAYLDKAQDAIVVLDLSDRIGYWNQGAERVALVGAPVRRSAWTVSVFSINSGTDRAMAAQ